MLKKFSLILFSLSLSMSAFAVDIDDLTQKANQGNADAQFQLANFHFAKNTFEDGQIGRAWIEKSAHLGHAEAQYYWGAYYHQQFKAKEAFEWYTKSAEQGQINAQYNLGLLNMGFLEIEENPQQAIFWFKKAAEKGHIKAQNNVGAFYFAGYGTEKNPEQAKYWLKQACDAGHPIACETLQDKIRWASINNGQ